MCRSGKWRFCFKISYPCLTQERAFALQQVFPPVHSNDKGNSNRHPLSMFYVGGTSLRALGVSDRASCTLFSPRTWVPESTNESLMSVDLCVRLDISEALMLQDNDYLLARGKRFASMFWSWECDFMDILTTTLAQLLRHRADGSCLVARGGVYGEAYWILKPDKSPWMF